MTRIEKDLRDAKRIIAALKDYTADLESRIAMIDSRCTDSLDYAKRMDYKPNSKIVEIQEISRAALKLKAKYLTELSGEFQALVKSERLEAFE